AGPSREALEVQARDLEDPPKVVVRRIIESTQPRRCPERRVQWRSQRMIRGKPRWVSGYRRGAWRMRLRVALVRLRVAVMGGVWMVLLGCRGPLAEAEHAYVEGEYPEAKRELAALEGA